jgi:antirestriction protein ArdC
MSRKPETQRADIYSLITDRIVDDLARGVKPWMKPRHDRNMKERITRPLRHNGKPYSGMNVLLLWSEGIARGFSSPMWMTFKQSLELGAAVRKGETGSTVVFASRFTKTEADANGGETDREIPFLKAYTVFNVEQIDGLPDHYHHGPAPVADPVQRIETADRFFRNTGAVIRHGGTQAYYSPVTDNVQMPEFACFRDAVAYYAVLLHECGHASGARHRLDRDLSGRFGSAAYAMEECTVELLSAMICADLNLSVEPRPDHARYIASWLEVLRSDKRAIFTAASRAQEIADWMHAQQAGAHRHDVRGAA